VLQCDAACCTALLCAAMCRNALLCCSMLQCCSVPQGVAFCTDNARLIVDGVLQLTVADFLSVVGKNPDRNRDVIRALSKSSKDRIARLKRMAHCPSYVARYIYT